MTDNNLKESPPQISSIFELFKLLFDYKRLVTSIVFLSLFVSITYGMLATKYYAAEATLTPRNQSNDALRSTARELSGMAGLVGMNFDIGSTGVSQTDEALAILKSRAFILPEVSITNIISRPSVFLLE